MSRKHHSPLVNILLVLIALLTVADITVIGLCLKTPGSGNKKPGTSQNPTEGPDAPEETVPQETRPTPVASATVLSTGDILMHSGVIATGKQEDGSYNFDSIFRYVNSYTQAADFSVANLETTLCGTDNGYRYSGNPKFNCPDAIVDSLKSAGFDLLLTANNHAADTSLVGFKRTLTTVRGKGLETLGTYLSSDEQKWTIQEVNGIKIGMVCYTWAYSSNGTSFSLNGLTPIKDEGQMNYFLNNDPGKLYTASEQILEQMKADGAEATMMFIHWGVEYNIKENSLQDTMAQKLCDLGFDVIVGGHPHVVQPVDLLTSTVDPDHKTVVIYSLGNAVSNQRNGYIQAAPPYYTEDGILFTVTFEKYSDGAVYLQSVDALPTWVNMRTDGAKQYNILPLDEDNQDQWAELFNLNDAMLSSAKKSMERTDSIVGAGMEKCRTYLEQQKADREAYYQDLASHPETYVPSTVPEETAGETIPETTAVTAPAA